METYLYENKLVVQKITLGLLAKKNVSYEVIAIDAYSEWNTWSRLLYMQRYYSGLDNIQIKKIQPVSRVPGSQPRSQGSFPISLGTRLGSIPLKA